jgi:hypothetical protein
MEVTDFYGSLLGAARRAVCILGSLSSGMWCRSLCSVSSRVSEEPATSVVRVEKVFLQTSVIIYWITCLYMPEKIDLHTFVNDRVPEPHTARLWSPSLKHHLHVLRTSNDAGEEMYMFYTGISHKGRSTKQSCTHVLVKHLADDDTKKGNTVFIRPWEHCRGPFVTLPLYRACLPRMDTGTFCFSAGSQGRLTKWPE